jgi:hypothetical protein
MAITLPTFEIATKSIGSVALLPASEEVQLTLIREPAASPKLA